MEINVAEKQRLGLREKMANQSAQLDEYTAPDGLLFDKDPLIFNITV